MATRPLVIAFDVIETLFPLEPIRQRLIDAGQPGHLLELWFSRLLRDAFALVATGGYRPFGEIATSALRSTVGPGVDDATLRTVLGGFSELEPHPDVVPAVRLAGEAGVRMVTLTNGSAQITSRLLERAGLDDDIEQVLSVDDVQRWKPAPEIYRHAAYSTHVLPERVALVAAHAWDTHGAHQAGLATGWVARLEATFPDIFSAPDVTGNDLVEVVRGLLALPTE
ncbi:haloacid dehalogenase type II [Actinobacteria bacterium YIM 96077]|uniref:Haloacid dehalogenase type II n=1 Tax=Phytoactinopolyspora halophila TaxID=1981511 RepID=A0A329QAR1_9ACTN|nr:haloacid dehalogenase type II [Phytoactinopolyspora halophila]AYY13734.1 haloacid dehalogenase type II [Actinobacteria bacterium YIM 96077]RAW09465.1 haloacid dehalogenase type II [Phytoactinopolyspora halophila]